MVAFISMILSTLKFHFTIHVLIIGSDVFLQPLLDVVLYTIKLTGAIGIQVCSLSLPPIKIVTNVAVK